MTESDQPPATRNDRAVIGGNSPPSPVDFGRAAFRDISAFLAGMPVVETEGQAREIKLQLDRAKAALGDIEAAKEQACKPLYESWKTASAIYTPTVSHLAALVHEVKARLSRWMQTQEALCEAEAIRKQQEAEAAIQLAMATSLAVTEALDNASCGELNVDLTTVIEEADRTDRAAKKALHQAQLAERDATVRVGGGFTRVATLRTKETLTIIDASIALEAIGLTDKISSAILAGARAYRTLHGNLPPGIACDVNREL